MNIEIKSFQLINFKGIPFFQATCKPGLTVFAGANGTGKTTIMDAWLWLLFDMDSRGYKGADAAKTTDGAQFVHQIENNVTFDVLINGVGATLSKSLVENWVRARGSEARTYQGNTVRWAVNDLPYTAAEWKAYVNGLVDADLFKLCSDPSYFMTLHWTKRLEMLTRLVGMPTDELIAGQDPVLLNYLRGRGELTDADYKKSLQARLSQINERMQSIPVRIDEQSRTIPAEQDWAALEAEVQTINDQLATLHLQMNDTQKSVSRVATIAARHEQAKAQLDQYLKLAKQADDAPWDAARQTLADLKAKRNLQAAGITRQRAIVDSATVSASSAKDAADELRAKYRSIWDEECPYTWQEPDAGALTCPTCHRPMTAEQLAEHLALAKDEHDERVERWTADRAKRLGNCQKLGQQAADVQKRQAAYLSDSLAALNQMESEADELEPQIEAQDALVKGLGQQPAKDHRSDPQALELQATIDETAQQIVDAASGEASRAITMEINQLDARRSMINAKLAGRGNAAEAGKRIAELRQQLAEAGEQRTALEQALIAGEAWSRAKTDALSRQINSRFTQVSFKLLSEQINGGVTEACEPVVNGTTMAKANTAGQINAGLEIIDVFSRAQDVFVPVFVDHLESVNNLYPLATQTIALLVTDQPQLSML